MKFLLHLQNQTDLSSISKTHNYLNYTFYNTRCVYVFMNVCTPHTHIINCKINKRISSQHDKRIFAYRHSYLGQRRDLASSSNRI